MKIRELITGVIAFIIIIGIGWSTDRSFLKENIILSASSTPPNKGNIDPIGKKNPQQSISQTDVKKPSSKSEQKSEVIAYYFHGNQRCVTCQSIEKQSKDVIENQFKKEIQDGKLQFKTVNIEEKSNQHYIDDYQLYSSSLVLTLHKDEKEMKWKNLTEVWLYARNSAKFYPYVTDETKKFIKEME